MAPSWDNEKTGWRNWRRYKVPGMIAVGAITLLGGGLGVAMAGTGSSDASGQTITCPTVADKLPAIPASAQAEVDRNLALLETQLQEANNRLATSAGEGGPNFVQNAILGPLADKRAATIDRIAISIGRTAEKPTNLGGLAECSLGAGGEDENAGGEDENAGGEDENAGGGEEAGGGAAAGAISCPDVAGELPEIPAQAQDEVTRNLELLDTQIAEANQRLVDTVGQGGANFVQNAILGPLEDKRVATINRIATAIGRNAERPDLDVATLAPCELNEDEVPVADPVEGGNGNAGGGDAGAGFTQLVINEANDGGSDGAIACPTVADQLPAIPNQALAEVESNLAQLEKQIQEAETRLANSAGEGGPNFVQNAIIGPLEDKRVAAINRIATAIGRHTDKPQLNVAGLAPCSEA
ncbi:hypothetical protein [Catenuloplanes atrovinosus]|uniref:F0F1-type ATP synthase membrane subunit b/b n=1 Tax=Catenuloplanes atrovinosus TaxID=137266 RepID=A0AAE3YTB5_9ACTN|nr:hypothetical protein [Catenuloplanes atrovinosus]MDR7279533.1 F0F1-type ATP synthase membrane subunit b/b' [Catenuloplanes atrovinosus]